jgi:hypothetical protein
LNKTNLKSAADNKGQTVPIVVNGILSQTRNNNNKKTDQKQRQKSKKHRVLLLGDSQMRGCTDILKHNLNSDFEISGIVKPGAKTKDILGTKIDEGMCTNDFIVVCAGANDISKNDAKEGLKNITNFVKQTRHTNIIVIETLHRYDLVD